MDTQGLEEILEAILDPKGILDILDHQGMLAVTAILDPKGTLVHWDILAAKGTLDLLQQSKGPMDTLGPRAILEVKDTPVAKDIQDRLRPYKVQ